MSARLDPTKYLESEDQKLVFRRGPGRTLDLTHCNNVFALASRMATLIVQFVENETSQTSYAELKGSNSMDIPVEFLALCEFAEEMGVKLP